MYKVRTFPDKNYRAFFINGKTLRVPINKEKPIEELDFPEFYDVRITNKCRGNCSYCYMSSLKNSPHAENLCENIKSYFGKLNENERPFQVAIGGGEPTEHPEFLNSLKTFYELGIVPNYTTNGMCVTKEVLEETKKYCAGVAITCHPHLEKFWKPAIEKYTGYSINTHLHNILYDKESVDYFLNIYNTYKDVIECFVLLPHMEMGRGDKKEIDWDYIESNVPNSDNIAFGSNFYNYLISSNKFKCSLYEPESMSKYLDMLSGSIYKSSFNLEFWKKAF